MSMGYVIVLFALAFMVQQINVDLQLAEWVIGVTEPVMSAMGVDPVLAGTAVFSGAALGSTTCLYGDGIILASKSVGVRPLTLMTSILPYAGAAAVLSFIAYLIAGFVMI